MRAFMYQICMMLVGIHITLQGHPGCQERTTLTGMKRIRHDLNWVSVVGQPCPCPCQRYDHIKKYGRCARCKHFVRLPDPLGECVPTCAELPARLAPYAMQTEYF